MMAKFNKGDKVEWRGGRGEVVVSEPDINGHLVVRNIEGVYLFSQEYLKPVPEPKYRRKSVSELMAEGWKFNTTGNLVSPSGEGCIGGCHLHIMGTSNVGGLGRPFFPKLWVEETPE